MSSSAGTATLSSSSSPSPFLLPPPNWPSAGPANLSHGLDQRSSLRKLPFPASARETLLRLLRQCATLVGSRKQPSPKEMEAVLDAIDEFIFNAGSKAAPAVTIKNIMASLALVEAQMIQTLFEFFNYCPESIPPVGGAFVLDRSVFVSAFVFVFMEPMGHSPGAASAASAPHLAHWSADAAPPSDQRLLLMGKVVSVALAERGRGALDCVGVWMHQEGAMSERPVRLVRFIISENLLQVRVPPRTGPRLRRSSSNRRSTSRLLSQDGQHQAQEGGGSPDESPDPLLQLYSDLPASGGEIFCANFMTAACRCYMTETDIQGTLPPAALVRLFAHWLKERPLLPFHCLLVRQKEPLPPGGQNLSHHSSLLGLAFWSVSSGLLLEKGVLRSAFNLLHLRVIETLFKAKEQRSLLKPEVLQVKHLVLFLQRVGSAMRAPPPHSSACSTEQLRQLRMTRTLERLGQLLLGLSYSDLVSGAAGPKAAADVIETLQALPGGLCPAIQLYVKQLAGGKKT